MMFFKVSIMLNNIMFLSLVVYFIYVDFSYTKHYLPAFDSKVKDFMLLYIFAMFSYTYELYSKVSDLDRTCFFEYSYTMVNKDKTFTKKRESVVKRRRESVQSALLIGNIGSINTAFMGGLMPNGHIQV